MIVGKVKEMSGKQVHEMKKLMVHHIETHGWDGSKDITVHMVNDYITPTYGLKLRSVRERETTMEENNFAFAWEVNEGYFVHIVEFQLPQETKKDCHAVAFFAEEKLLIDNTKFKQPVQLEKKDYMELLDDNGNVLKKAGKVATEAMNYFLSKDLADFDGQKMEVRSICKHTFEVVPTEE